eukprot:TRINITY_DN22729_c0_g2_i1.p1 TRINITY_DN22729_c0_g2~~TRINITY_DN22729_c0_g2_i1.p1  ORF type:complete len:728 (+),score=104.12 TRINITY_DN22729_c0_g2_i1:124-2307(+)
MSTRQVRRWTPRLKAGLPAEAGLDVDRPRKVILTPGPTARYVEINASGTFPPDERTQPKASLRSVVHAEVDTPIAKQQRTKSWHQTDEDVRLMTPTSASAAFQVFVVWHKWSDLRLDDHEPAIWAHHEAARRSGVDVDNRVLHVHVLEPALFDVSRIAGLPRCGQLRASFWRESVDDLADGLRRRGQRLVVRAGDAERVLAEDLACGLQALGGRLVAVAAHREFCDEELRTESRVREALEAIGAKLVLFWGGLTVHHVDDLGFDPWDKRQMPNLYQPFLKAVRGQRLRPPVNAPSRLAEPPPLGLQDWSDDTTEAFRAVGCAFAANMKDEPLVPFHRQARARWVGGESAAHRHFEAYAWTENKLRRYVGASDSMHPGEHNAINSTTRLAPWLAFGCISPRRVVAEVQRYERERTKNRSTYWVYHELVFRDFFRFSCLWWGTSLFKLGGPFGVRGLKWRRDDHLLQRWIAGRTGFPFVDAGMRELAATGYMSHLHRQCCASFLIRDLRLDWRMGAEYFESALVDYTPDANWGNWAYRTLPRPQLVERGCPCRRHITTLEILSWPCVHDPQLDHILRWIPELRSLPADMVREPWRRKGTLAERVWIMPEKDSPLWFTSVNRVNWPEYQSMLTGWAWTVRGVSDGSRSAAKDFDGEDYPDPIVPALCLEVDLDKIPLDHSWGDTPTQHRPHVVGERGAGRGGNKQGRPKASRGKLGGGGYSAKRVWGEVA